MKKSFLILGVLIVLILIVGGIIVFLLATKSSPVPSPTSSTTFPTSSIVPGETASETETSLKQSFSSQIQNANQITLGASDIVMPYALQSWGDTNKGGNALLVYNQSNGWILVSLGGGYWDVPSLVAQGVPQDVATELVAKQP